MNNCEPDRPRTQRSARTPRSTPPGPGLAAAIGAGLRALANLHRPHPDVTSGALERALRDAAAAGAPRLRVSGTAAADPHAAAAAAILTACAHLGAGGLVDAYLALLAAHDALPHGHRAAASRSGDRAEDDVTTAVEGQTGADGTVGDDFGSNDENALRRRVAEVLNAQAALGQAGGMLAARFGLTVEQALAMLCGYAERHRFVLDELAGDVVAGRPPPGLIAGLADGHDASPDTPGDRVR